MMAKSRSAFLSVLWVFIGLVALAYMALSDNCRSIQFEPLITNKALLNHTIKTLIVKGQGSCEARCYQDENCVSYNFGPVGGTLPNCELNRVTHQQALEGEFVSREGYIYRHILNKCQSNPCLNNSTCQAGFTSKAYRCICVDGYEGEHCEFEDSGSVPWSCYKRTCYLLFTELQTWHNAQAACIRYGGFLAKIENSAINKFLKDEFFVTDGMYWIGLSDSVKEGKWIWEDQTELKGFQGWDKNEPNGNSLENCAGIGKILLGTFDGEWFDSPCHIPRGFICQKK